MFKKKRGKMKKILVASAKGGVGKTTTAINLAAALTMFGKKTLLVDGNLAAPDIGLYLGAPIIPISLHHVIAGFSDSTEAVYEHHSGLHIMPGSLELSSRSIIQRRTLKSVLEDIKETYGHEFAIIDSHANLNSNAHALHAADAIVVITSPDLPSLTHALRTIKQTEKARKEILGVVLNMYSAKRMSRESVEKFLEQKVLGIIPESEEIKESQNSREILVHAFPVSSAARAYKQLASQILGGTYSDKEKNIPREGESFVYRFARVLGFAV